MFTPTMFSRRRTLVFSGCFSGVAKDIEAPRKVGEVIVLLIFILYY